MLCRTTISHESTLIEEQGTWRFLSMVSPYSRVKSSKLVAESWEVQRHMETYVLFSKKVLLGEPMRHTYHCVGSTCCAALSRGGGVPPPIPMCVCGGGYPIQPNKGYPHPGQLGGGGTSISTPPPSWPG